MSNQYCVIMAGGVGSRFWPKSNALCPKQFLDVLGRGRTLIQQTYDRFSHQIPNENFFVVTNQEYVDIVKEQLPFIKEENILAEPCMRNTAPCIAYAMKRIEKLSNDAVMVVTPADHLIEKQDIFEEVLRKGLGYVSKHNDILTIGIEPSHPNTGYGYIEFKRSQKLPPFEPRNVIQFKEKPQKEVAERYVKAGNFSWNSGMFMWNLETIRKNFEEFEPELMELFEEKDNDFGTDKETEAINYVYDRCQEISIDYAVLERSKNVKVINTDIGWSDIGTWLAIEEHIAKTSKNNAIISGETLMHDSYNNIVSLPQGKILVTAGIENLIIVEKDGVLMIVTKEYDQEIKKLRKLAGDKFGKKIL